MARRQDSPMPITSYTAAELAEVGRAVMICLCNAGYICEFVEPCKSPKEFEVALKRLMARWESYKAENGMAEYWQ